MILVKRNLLDHNESIETHYSIYSENVNVFLESEEDIYLECDLDIKYSYVLPHSKYTYGTTSNFYPDIPEKKDNFPKNILNFYIPCRQDEIINGNNIQKIDFLSEPVVSQVENNQSYNQIYHTNVLNSQPIVYNSNNFFYNDTVKKNINNIIRENIVKEHTTRESNILNNIDTVEEKININRIKNIIKKRVDEYNIDIIEKEISADTVSSHNAVEDVNVIIKKISSEQDSKIHHLKEDFKQQLQYAKSQINKETEEIVEKALNQLLMS